jgi:hypothetical protein
MENINSGHDRRSLVATQDKLQAINREEFVRLIIQALKEEGFRYYTV